MTPTDASDTHRLRAHHWPSAIVVVALLLATSAADAALTTDTCLALKRQAWGYLRKCEAVEQAKQLKGKPADLAKCQTKFQEKLATITEKATKTAIACRYGDNGHGTVTNYDTGLQWEQKTGVAANPPDPEFCAGGDVHCVNATFDWNTAMRFADASADGSILTTCFSGHCDWRLPKIVELETILLEPFPCGTSPCIDPIFDPPAALGYWSSTTNSFDPADPDGAWTVFFSNGNALNVFKGVTNHARAVRGAF